MATILPAIPIAYRWPLFSTLQWYIYDEDGLGASNQKRHVASQICIYGNTWGLTNQVDLTIMITIIYIEQGWTWR